MVAALRRFEGSHNTGSDIRFQAFISYLFFLSDTSLSLAKELLNIIDNESNGRSGSAYENPIVSIDLDVGTPISRSGSFRLHPERAGLPAHAN